MSLPSTRRAGPWLAALAGVVALGFAVRHVDWAETVQAMRRAGWAAAAVLVTRSLTMAFATLGWRELMGRYAPALAEVTAVRLAREGCNALLPFTAVGGDVIGARLLARRGVPGDVAAATSLADVLIQSAAQLLFTLTGIALLAGEGHARLAAWTLPGVALIALALAAFLLLQRSGAARWVDRAAASAAARWPDLVAGRFDLRARLGELYARPVVPATSYALHLAGWAVDAAAPWLVLTALGYHPTLAEAVVIESLSQALRGAAFFVPAGVGVQEGGLVLLCGLYGVPPEAALTLSLVKRLCDVVIGVPGLLLWWRIEAEAKVPRALTPR